MKEHPILFSTEMVKAILDGRKTQTRRVIKLSRSWFDKNGKLVDTNYWKGEDLVKTIKCPYGQVGDHLWCKETHYRFGHWVKNGITKTGKQKWRFKANDHEVWFWDNPPTENVHRLGEKNAVGWFKRSSLFLPREFSRLTLEITEIRVQRVQEISGDDALAEGVSLDGAIVGHDYNIDSEYREGFLIAQYRALWNSINGKKYPWESNPYVWAITFKVIRQQ